MNWTTRRPTVPGWWWHRSRLTRAVCVSPDMRVEEFAFLPVKSCGGEWSSSPIPEPVEAEDE